MARQNERSRGRLFTGVRPATISVLLLPLIGMTLMGLPSCASCTEAGCGSQVTFWLDADLEAGQPYVVETCVDDVCRAGTLEVPDNDEDGLVPASEIGDLGMDTGDDIVYVTLPADQDWSGTHSTALTVIDGESTIVSHRETGTTFTRIQPNGPNCSPTCWEAEVNI